MRLSEVYRNTASAFMLIGACALGLFWLGGWAVATFMNHYYGFCYDPLRCCIPFGQVRLPFWPVASLLVLILHGVFVFRYSSLRASLGVPQRWWEGGRAGGYDAQLDNPFVRVIAKDCVVVGSLLIFFLVLSSCRQWFGWCWWGC